ncbi:PH domain-containing protein [Natrinema zhouii]|uniref:PH domain-containing protein n=1 Tax=Natrinema zhouii TaxID=1710539 RepID=A0A7D6GJY2_9EURY|nr:PH domain-containing protein [Natrinema zhouii]QLK25699.1 PH domain-containing protein [Natrinema zhouii]
MTRTNPSDSAAESTGPSAGGDPTGNPAWLPLESADGERIRWQGSPRIQTVLPWAAFALVGMVALLAGVVTEVLPVLAVVGIPVVVAPALWQYAHVSRTAFVVTDSVAATRHGVFGIRVRTISLERIQNTTVEQDPIGRLVGYGTVTIETASGSELAFWNVEEPGRIRERLEAERKRLTGGEIPGRPEQWNAVLEEVREWRRVLERNP